LDRKLSAYHYGASASTASKYKLDIRGEVALLSRNVRIQGTDLEAWGCQVLTSDFVEGDGKTQRRGNTVMDHVEIYNCSQYDTKKAALRWYLSMNGWSSITNSSIYHGYG
jgi:hypothetical protein